MLDDEVVQKLEIRTWSESTMMSLTSERATVRPSSLSLDSPRPLFVEVLVASVGWGGELVEG